MNGLPDELLLMILDYLPPQELHDIGRVSKHWALVVHQRAQLICKHRTLKVNNRLRSLIVKVAVPNLINKLLPATNLQSLTITIDVSLNSEDFSTLAQFPNIRHIDVFSETGIINALPPQLNSVVINDIITRPCMKTVINAKRINSLHCFGRARPITAPQLKNLITTHKSSLTEITLKCRELPSRTFQCFSECNNLTALRLYECWRLCKEHTIYISKPSLKILHLTGIRLIGSNSLATLITTFPETLEELCVSASCFEDEHIDLLTKHIPNLRVFEAWRCNMSTSGVLQLAEGLPRLCKLDTDILLKKDDLFSLEKHPKLKQVRCLLADPLEKTLKLKIIKANTKSRLFRNVGEGFRSDIFYYSNRNSMQTD